MTEHLLVREGVTGPDASSEGIVAHEPGCTNPPIEGFCRYALSGGLVVLTRGRKCS